MNQYRVGLLGVFLFAACAFAAPAAALAAGPQVLHAPGQVARGDTTAITFDGGLATQCELSFAGPEGLKAGPFKKDFRGGILRASWRVDRHAAPGRWVVKVACSEPSSSTKTSRVSIRVPGRSRSNHKAVVAKSSFRFGVARRSGAPTVPQTLTAQDNEQGPPLGDQLGAGPYPNATIADIGLSKLGRHEGQCKQAVNNWVFAASGGHQRLGGDYYGNYAQQGGLQIGRDQAVKGDIIQLSNPRDRRNYYWPMHTAVVVSHQAGSNTFDVVDSNYSANNDEIARHHSWNPYASARGLDVTIWRMGDVPTGGNPAGGDTPAGPGPNPFGNDLEFVKTRGTPNTVEVHWATGASGFQQRGGDFTSDFSPTDGDNGTWQLFGSANGAPMLGFVKTRSTPNTVEVHWDALTDGSYHRVGSFTSDFSPADANNGTWQLFGSANGAPMLGFVKTRNTGGTVEVHWDVLSDGSYHRAGSYTSDFSPADADNGTWQLFGSANGAPMLGFVKTRNTPNTVEVHWDAMSDGSYHRAGSVTSDFSPADANNGTWQLSGSGSGAPGLRFVKTRNTAGTIEVHWDVLTDGSYRRAGDSSSNFSPVDADKGFWQLGPF